MLHATRAKRPARKVDAQDHRALPMTRRWQTRSSRCVFLRTSSAGWLGPAGADVYKVFRNSSARCLASQIRAITFPISR